MSRSFPKLSQISNLSLSRTGTVIRVGGDAVASLTDDNAADSKIGGAGSLIIGRMEHYDISNIL